MSIVEVKVKKLDENAKLPQFAHQDDACADLYAISSFDLNPGQQNLIGTGIALQIPLGYEAQIRPRSGLAAKHGITVVNSPGTIDAGYRGEIKVILLNTSTDTFTVKKQMRIAQIAIRPLPKVRFTEVVQLEDSERSFGGFGSTGLT